MSCKPPYYRIVKIDDTTSPQVRTVVNNKNWGFDSSHMLAEMLQTRFQVDAMISFHLEEIDEETKNNLLSKVEYKIERK